MFQKLEQAYDSFLLTVRENKMEQRIKEGVLLGFSGGPDSMLLLHCLLRYKKTKDFPLVAVHVHHGIRGVAADRDADFAQQICAEKNVEFICKRVNVPAFAIEKHIGIEEAARILRYSCFDEIIRGRNDVSVIAVAHNSTDNLETVIFNLMRGCGTGGLSGIAPVRDNIIRPLLSLTKEQILSALSEANIAYITDESNMDISYTRNYIRNEILPKLYRISGSAEVSVRRLCRNLRSDNDYLENEAQREYECMKNGKVEYSHLLSLHPAIFARVIKHWGAEFSLSFTQKQIELLRARLCIGGNFLFDLGGGYFFCLDRGLCFFQKSTETAKIGSSFAQKIIPDQLITLKRGSFMLSHSDLSNISLNIYKFSIKKNLSSAIIEGELFLRYRKEGDSYFYGGMKRKLKKLFNDKKIPLSERESLPILCDSKGIVWVPGFGVRDDGGCDRNALNAVFFY